jgi:predicted DNA-binding helix-hairpin-helix protein
LSKENCLGQFFKKDNDFNYLFRASYTTMEQVVNVARRLREQHHFRGYIHLKTIPEADDALIAEAGKYADRLSINIEVPEETSLAKLAPEKDARAIRHGPAAFKAR